MNYLIVYKDGSLSLIMDWQRGTAYDCTISVANPGEQMSYPMPIGVGPAHLMVRMAHHNKLNIYTWPLE